MIHYKSVFQHVDVKNVLKLFEKNQIAVAMVKKNFPLKIVIFQILSNFSEIWYFDSVFDPEEEYVKSF